MRGYIKFENDYKSLLKKYDSEQAHEYKLANCKFQGSKFS